MQSTPNDRVLFLDNLRWVIIFLVITLHAGCAYSFYTTYWAVNDNNSRFFDILLGILLLFEMPTLFFISGYFAIPSFNSKTTASFFIKRKINRLAIPWLVGVVLLGPVKALIYNYSRDDQSLNFLDHFKILMINALSLQTAPLETIDQFNHWHLWYISLLFYFFLIFVAAVKLTKWFNLSLPFKSGGVASDKEILLVLFSAALGASLLILAARFGIFNGKVRDPWLVIVTIFQFKTSNLILHFICFWVGVYAYHRNWFSHKKPPGNPMIWSIASILLLGGMIGTLVLKMNTLSVFVQNFACFAIILFFLSFTRKTLNRNNRLTNSLAGNSYNIYLVHMVFIITLQLALFKLWTGFIFVKFFIVTVLTIIFSYLVSRFALTPHPRLSVAGLFGLFIVLCLIV